MKDKHNLWIVLPMRCLLFFAAFSLCNIIAQKNFTEITHWWTIIASGINMVTIVVLLVICKHGNTTFRELIHYEKRMETVSREFCLFFSMLLLGMGGMYCAGGLCYDVFKMNGCSHPCIFMPYSIALFLRYWM